MINILHPTGFEFAAAHRLQRLSVVLRTFSDDEVVELTASTQDLVYVLPLAAMDSPVWPRMRVRFARANRPFMIFLDRVSTSDVARSMRDGALDVIAIDDSDERWKEAMRRVTDHQSVWLQLYGGRPLSADDVLIGRSASIQRLQQTIDRLGPTNVCVLINGESGVGKERVASALHKAGPGGRFIALNCAAIPKDLLEAELFGVEKGAFTGAHKARPGLVEQANGGTLFLDEIGEMEISVQPKLLRFLETRHARRVGGEGEYRVNVRVVSATNRNLDTEIGENRFRADLYYRLAEIILQVPPLRSRPEDLPELALAFLRNANERFGKNFETIEPALITRFARYSWPGNVRELKSTIDRMVLLFDGPVLRGPWWDQPEEPRRRAETSAFQGREARPSLGGESDSSPAPEARLPLVPNHRQKMALARKLLQESDNNYSWVAGQLGVNSSTLWRWRKSGKLDEHP